MAKRNSTREPCPTCEGEGKVWRSRWGGNDPDVWAEPCPECAIPDADYLRDRAIDKQGRER